MNNLNLFNCNSTDSNNINNNQEIMKENLLSSDSLAYLTEKSKSVNDIFNQANRLMKDIYMNNNFQRGEKIREIAFRYYDNIRQYAKNSGMPFNEHNDCEFIVEYPISAYMR